MKLGNFGRGDENMHLSFTLLPDVGPLWSQGLEGTSVSIGCEIRKLWKGWRKYAVGSEAGPRFSWTVPSRGFEGTSVSMGCEIRKLWKGVIT